MSAAALAAAVGSTLAIRGIETHQIYDGGEQAEIMKRAKTAVDAYKPPTA